MYLFVKGKYLGSNRMKAQELKRKKKTEKRGNKSEGNFRLKMQLFVLVSIKFLFFYCLQYWQSCSLNSLGEFFSCILDTH